MAIHAVSRRMEVERLGDDVAESYNVFERLDWTHLLNQYAVATAPSKTARSVAMHMAKVRIWTSFHHPRRLMD